ncbi:hypothetical protein PMAYCL1PPCAC_01759, partial [Pristionchus mayeri]
MYSHSLRCLARMRLLRMAPQSSQSMEQLRNVSERKNYSGAPFNESEILVNRGGNSIDKFIQTRFFPCISTIGNTKQQDSVTVVVEEFARRSSVRKLAAENELTKKIFTKS